MDNELEKILSVQITKLPKEVVSFISSANWEEDLDEIASLYNLSREELAAFKREVTLVLAGLTYPDEFSEVLEQEVGIQGSVLDAIVKNVEDQILAPIRPALLNFFEEEASKEVPTVTETPGEDKGIQSTKEESFEIKNKDVATEAAPEVLTAKEELPKEVLAPTAKMWERISGAAPDNLPVAEEVLPLIPPIPPKNALGESVPSHPFEEKMKQVFTSTQQKEDLTLEPTFPGVPPASQTLEVSPTYHKDPYREPIE